MTLELYNLATDISETKNLVTADPARAKAMYAQASALMRDAAPFPTAASSGAPGKSGKAGKKGGKGGKKGKF